ncbi:hypothetical protein GCM10023149_48880 [Mucilaginibacter gynuensis]|uniref:Recombination protein RecT n=1 Tax=Mucilaginibacter gynuensis TaxID=1302236 RepID=A0ABP8HFL6_9SPHI
MDTTAVQTTTTAAVQKPAQSQSERFTNAVMKEFGSNAGALELTSFQRKLIQNYFIKLDGALKDAEIKRMAKREEKRDLLAYTWENINMPKLAVDVVAFSAVGLDPAQPNHINVIPYKNNNTNKYDVTFIMGYRGMQLKAMKYGFEIPDDVIVELVYTKDVFKSIKKSWNNRIENYEFQIVDDFDRGEVKGGFYYHAFHDSPEKNRLEVFTLKDIEKRKPKYAAAEFWGGEKDVWKNGEVVGKEKVEGWYEEMCYKTIFRAAYNDITIDSEKIDEHFVRMMQTENDTVSTKVQNEIAQNANKTELSFDDAVYVEDKQLPISISNTTESPLVDNTSAVVGESNPGALLNNQPANVQERKGPGF